MGRRRRLLLVNDDVVGNKIFVESFNRRGVEAVIVGSAREAIEKVKSAEFDLIVTDIELKEGPKAGLAFIKDIRKIDRDVKIFVSTGYGDYFKEEALAAGADGYFEKPYDMEEIFNKPLGLKKEKKTKKRRKNVVKIDKNLSLRKIIHDLGNRHNCVVMVSSLLKEAVEELRGEEISGKIKKIIARAAADLADIEEAGKEADLLLKKIRKTVYEKIDPDKIKVNGR